MIVPPGWLAYGAEAAADGRVWPPLAGVLGMGLIGAVSLRRAYGTTLRLYRGDFDRGRRPAPSAIRDVASGRAMRARHSTSWWKGGSMDIGARLGGRRELPVVDAGARDEDDAVDACVHAGRVLRDVCRSERQGARADAAAHHVGPCGVHAGPRHGWTHREPVRLRPFRFSGLRSDPAQRRDVLMGKNLSLLPFAFATMSSVVGLSQWFNPMRFDHFVALLFQLVSTYCSSVSPGTCFRSWFRWH